MKNKVILSFYVLAETRKILKTMAVDEEKSMATLIEEMIIIRWQEKNIKTKNGTI